MIWKKESISIAKIIVCNSIYYYLFTVISESADYWNLKFKNEQFKYTKFIFKMYLIQIKRTTF